MCVHPPNSFYFAAVCSSLLTLYQEAAHFKCILIPFQVLAEKMWWSISCRREPTFTPGTTEDSSRCTTPAPSATLKSSASCCVRAPTQTPETTGTTLHYTRLPSRERLMFVLVRIQCWLFQSTGNSLIYTRLRLQEGWADLSQIHLLTIGGVWTGISW